MKILPIIILSLLLASFMLFQSVNVADGHLYEERISAFHRYQGETFRWETTREFLIVDYSILTTNISTSMEIELLHNTQRGQIETIIQPLKTSNFELTKILNDDGTPLEYSWEIYLFRDSDPINVISFKLDNSIRSAFINKDQRTFDIKSTTEFFSVNLQHVEYQFIDGKSEQYQVNTELSTKNYKDGRIEKSAVHLRKVNDKDEVVFEYDLEIQEKSIVQRYINALDQPAWKVPFQLGGILLLVYVYIQLHKYWIENDFRIIRGKGKIITIEIEEEANTSDIPSTDSEKEDVK